MDEIISTVDAGQGGNVDLQTQETNAINNTQVNSDSVNGEVAAPQNEKPVQSAEDNAKFAAIRREAEQKARDKARDELIAEMYGDQGITTYSDYQRAVEEARRQEEINRLVQQNVPEEYAREMLENRRFREELAQERKASEEKANKERQFQEFLELYPDIKAEEVPPEVWKDFEQGRSLVDAYARHENRMLKEELNKYREKENALAANKANAQSSTGSVKGTGTPESGFISKEVFEANKGNQKWMSDNYDNLKKSMSKWR